MSTLFLCANPSALSGVGRIFGVFGGFDAYNRSATGADADGRAILADWLMVGEDVSAAIDRYGKSVEQEAPKK